MLKDDLEKGRYEKMIDSFIYFFDVLPVYLQVLIFWLLCVLIYSFLKSVSDFKKKGHDVDGSFIYNEPKLIKTVSFSHVDDKKEIFVNADGSPKSLMVGYKVEYLGGTGVITIGLGTGFENSINRDKQSGSIRCNVGFPVILHCPENSTRTTARIYQTSVGK